MTIVVNGQSRTVQPGATLASLLVELGLNEKPCAAEVNRRVVPRTEHQGRLLKDGDTIELVTLVGGG